MALFKILRVAEWDALAAAGATRGAPIDLRDGFVHLSSRSQVEETARLHFADRGDLVLVAVDEGRLGAALQWEASRGGALFPHLFRELRMTDVLWHRPLPWRDGAHDFAWE